MSQNKLNNKNNEPLISIVLRTFKRSNKIRGCIDNILEQKYKNWEIIIVDDNGKSSDFGGEARDIVSKHYSHLDQIKVFEHEINMGLCAAGNTGIENSNGEYLAFIDDDDLWDNRKLMLQVKEVVLNKDLGIIFSGLSCIDKIENTRKIINFNLGEDLFTGLLKKGSGICTSTILIKKDILIKINGFDRSGLPAYTDFDLLLRASQNTQYKEISQPLVSYYVDQDGVSRDYTAKFKGKKIVLSRYRHYYQSLGLNSFFARHLGVLGDYALLQKNRFLAAFIYLKALLINPTLTNLYFKIPVSLLGGRSLYLFILNRNKH